MRFLSSAMSTAMPDGVRRHRRHTSGIAVDIASDKNLTNRLLTAGLPVPKRRSSTADATVAAAKRVGYPVVVKPLDGNHGRGVASTCAREDEVRAAFDGARGESRQRRRRRRDVHHRQRLPLLVIGGKLAASPSGCRRTSSATASTRSRELVDRRTPTRAAASATRRS